MQATEPKKIARFTPSHIVAFRAHNNVASIDELKDLNQQSNDVLGIYAKFSELEIKGNELVTLSHDYTSACTTKIVWHTQDTFKRAKEYSDQCVAQNLDDKSTLELNVSVSIVFMLHVNFYQAFSSNR